MFGSEVLDVAIGIVFVYTMLSLVCVAIQELLEAFLKNRARDLERGIRDLLGDEHGTTVETLYYHPLINSLFPGSYRRGRYSNLPSYIPARNFALALMDMLAQAGPQATSGATGATAAPALGGPPPGPSFRGVQLMRLREAIQSNPSIDKARQGLLTLIDAADSDPVRARENIEHWFNSAMGSVSGRFKRRTHLSVSAIAVGVAFAINADSIGIVNHLSTNKSVHQLLIGVAQEYAKLTAEPLKPRDGQLPARAAAAPVETSTVTIPACWMDPASPQCRVETSLERIRISGLPIGWARAPMSAEPRGIPERPLGWFLKITGILLTALATSVGAAFWFDVLNKFVVVRSTVKPHEKSPEESSQA